MSFTTLAIWILGIIYVLTCCWMVLVVLIQEGKSGGMSSMDTAAQSPQALTDSLGVGGAQKGLFRMTAGTAAVFFILAVTLTVIGNRQTQEGGTLDLDSAPAASQTIPLSTTNDSVIEITPDMLTNE